MTFTVVPGTKRDSRQSGSPRHRSFGSPTTSPKPAPLSASSDLVDLCSLPLISCGHSGHSALDNSTEGFCWGCFKGEKSLSYERGRERSTSPVERTPSGASSSERKSVRFAQAVVVWETYSLAEYPERSSLATAKDDDPNGSSSMVSGEGAGDNSRIRTWPKLDDNRSKRGVNLMGSW